MHTKRDKLSTQREKKEILRFSLKSKHIFGFFFRTEGHENHLALQKTLRCYEISLSFILHINYLSASIYLCISRYLKFQRITREHINMR